MAGCGESKHSRPVFKAAMVYRGNEQEQWAFLAEEVGHAGDICCGEGCNRNVVWIPADNVHMGMCDWCWWYGRKGEDMTPRTPVWDGVGPVEWGE